MSEASNATGTSLRGRYRPERLLDNYGLVLILLLAAFLVMPLAGEGSEWRILVILVAGAALLATYRASNVQPRTMKMAAAFVAVAVTSALAAEVTQRSFRSEWLLIPLGALFLAGPWVILRRIFGEHRTVTLQTILGAICGYLYLGLIFAVVFATSDAVGAAPFFAQTDQPSSGDFTYFSFVTLTTLGYGDLSPASQAAQHLAVLEALIGSLYLVTLVGRLVGMYGKQELGTSGDGGSP